MLHFFVLWNMVSTSPPSLSGVCSASLDFKSSSQPGSTYVLLLSNYYYLGTTASIIHNLDKDNTALFFLRNMPYNTQSLIRFLSQDKPPK